MIFATFRLVFILLFRFLGKLVFTFSKKRKNIAIKNLKLCFPDKNNKELNKISKNSFILLGHSFADFFLVRFYKNKYFKKHFKVNGIDYLIKTLDEGKGVILSAAHFGSFELAAHFLALKGFKSLILYNPIKKNPRVEKFVKNNREYSGNKLISKHNSLVAVYRRLKKGGIVLFAADQNCYSTEGIKVPLFSNNTFTHTGFINLSLKTGVPIVSGFIYTKNLFDYQIDVYLPLYPKDFVNLRNPEYEMTLALNKILERAIKKSPAHWMWQHRRFKDLIKY
ncbi:hypothetical protein GF385_03240 [Candidatus Dependentiae bacterium]|nr:hypothetical protein [Candidatus Dependentiae bacterium]